MTMEITQAALNQLMGFLFSVALIYLAIAFVLTLMRRRAATNSLSDYSPSLQSPLQSSPPFQDSIVSSMEPVLDWFEPTGQASAAQSGEARRPHRAQQTEKSLAKNISPSKGSVVKNISPLEGRDKLASLARPLITPSQAVPTFDTAPALTAPLVDGFFQDEEDMFAGEFSRSPQNGALKPESSTSKQKNLEQDTTASKQPKSVGQELAEPAIAQNNIAQEDVWEPSEQPEPVGEELTEPEIAEFAELFASQVEMSAAASSETRREDCIQPEPPDPENSRAMEPIPPEFDDIWTLVGKPESALGTGAAGLFADLEALLKPEVKAVQLDQSIADIEELASLNLDELFASPSRVSASAQYRPKPIEESDGPTEEELEEIFGSQF